MIHSGQGRPLRQTWQGMEGYGVERIGLADKDGIGQELRGLDGTGRAWTGEADAGWRGKARNGWARRVMVRQTRTWRDGNGAELHGLASHGVARQSRIGMDGICPEGHGEPRQTWHGRERRGLARTGMSGQTKYRKGKLSGIGLARQTWHDKECRGRERNGRARQTRNGGEWP